jgi:NADH:ubiquinone oxidoreductase subunit B-like Fe-S oxidoreductase
MTENKKPVSVIFAPGCFDTFEGTQEELDALMEEIQETFANMSPEELEAQSLIVHEDELEDNIEDVMQHLISSSTRTLQ